MSLLPQQILPETEPLGRASSSGEVRITHNWYLLLYHLVANVLGGPAAPPVPPAVDVAVTASPFTFQASEDGDLAVTGGLISKITLMRYDVTVQIGITAQLFPVRQGDSVSIIYSEAPKITFFPD